MILYTPLPPQLTVQHTVTQMARLDRRFDRPELLRGDPALLVQDSARLLNAYLVLCAPHGEWRGDPLAPAGGLHLTEGAWRTGLGLDSVATVHVGPAHLTALSTWTAGVVTLFTATADDPVPRLSRLLNLGTFLDRMELDFLLDSGLPGVRVLYAHRLEPGGWLTLWRAGQCAPATVTGNPGVQLQ